MTEKVFHYIVYPLADFHIYWIKLGFFGLYILLDNWAY